MSHLKLKEIEIRNFRSIKNERILIDDYTAIVGSNGSGKSTILSALNVFFGESFGGINPRTDVSAEDFHMGNVDEPIEITLYFEVISDKAREELSHYVQDDRLTVSTVLTFDPKSERARLDQRGKTMSIPAFVEYRDLNGQKGATADQKKAKYAEIRKTYPGLTEENTVPKQILALSQFEQKHPGLLEEVSSSDQFYGVEGVGKLTPFIQWVYVPAVKDAAIEQSGNKNTALEKLVTRAIRNKVDFSVQMSLIKDQARESYDEMLEKEKASLTELSKKLSERIQTLSHPEIELTLSWREGGNEAVSVRPPMASADVNEFKAISHSISRCGHGVQRSYLLALLQELADTETPDGPTLLLGIEEPELYQHPPQARHLAGVLEQLTEKEDQVLITTHSPYFVSAEKLSSIRHASRDNVGRDTKVVGCNLKNIQKRLDDAGVGKPLSAEGLMAKLQPELYAGLNEMFFSRCLVLVEGQEDLSYLTSHAVLNGHWEEFRRLGITILPVNGKGHLPRPMAIAQELGCKAFVVFDTDSGETDVGKRNLHSKDNKGIFNLLGISTIDGFLDDDLLAENCFAAKCDIGTVITADFEEDALRKARDHASEQLGFAGDLKKNPLYIGHLLSKLKEEGVTSATLDSICKTIIAFAGSNT
ncbi:hypothetical protein CCB80_02210 [Armatimonadetes bacterium Uphvl-Ar1]|nr:hypothetical protein CCB80_02210 [Armatimonadetes bacterium Uphvl-Ar1]